MSKLNDRVHSYMKQNREQFTARVVLLFGLSLILFGFCMDTPENIYHGFITIMVSPCGLITDYIALAGIGAAFLNAGLVTITAMLMATYFKAPYTGMLIASIFMSGGFALFGKNILNIWPIYLGVFLYSRYKGEPFGKHLHLAFFGTALGPLVSEVAMIFSDYHPIIRILAAAVVGTACGFILPPVSTHTYKFHKGYNLFNAGFATGLIATVFVSIMRSFGYTPIKMFYWSTEYTNLLAAYLIALFVILIVVGFWLDRCAIKDLKYITRHSGQGADYIGTLGFPGTMINMGLIGLFFTFYLLAIGGAINGPTAGCILSIAGFGAAGVNLRNTLFIVLGVIFGSFVKVWNLTDPAVQLSVLLCTGLAPLAGKYGLFYGMLSGFIHSSVVLNVGTLYSSLNLYNNGFSTGLVAAFLAPLLPELKAPQIDQTYIHCPILPKGEESK